MKALLAFVVVLGAGCTAAQKDAFFADLERVRDLAGDVCVEREGWEACLKKCEQAEAKERSDAAGP